VSSGRNKKRIRIFAAAALLFAAAAVLFSTAVIRSGDLPGDSGSGTREPALTVRFIDVGQGDCTLITCGGESMLIDGGPEDIGMKLWSYLKDCGAETLKYAVATHPDADHIGSLDVIAYRCEVGTFLMPGVESDTAAYDSLMNVIEEENIPVENPSPGTVYTLGSATVTVVGPVKDYDAEDTNDWSLCLMVECGDTRFLFTGDAESLAEHDMISSGEDLSADVLKVGHHGSGSSTSEEFLEAVNPRYAVISCGKDNPYGHPHDSVLARLEERGITLFRTDLQGTITAYSDGTSIWFDRLPAEDAWEDSAA
jgi:competence protein ComEC